MQITLDIKDSALDKILYFLDDVTIIPHQNSPKLEIIDKNDLDFRYIVEARKRRDNGEKTYTIDEMIQEFK